MLPRGGDRRRELDEAWLTCLEISDLAHLQLGACCWRADATESLKMVKVSPLQADNVRRTNYWDGPSCRGTRHGSGGGFQSALG